MTMPRTHGKASTYRYCTKGPHGTACARCKAAHSERITRQRENRAINAAEPAAERLSQASGQDGIPAGMARSAPGLAPRPVYVRKPRLSVTPDWRPDIWESFKGMMLKLNASPVGSCVRLASKDKSEITELRELTQAFMSAHPDIPLEYEADRALTRIDYWLSEDGEPETVDFPPLVSAEPAAEPYYQDDSKYDDAEWLYA